MNLDLVAGEEKQSSLLGSCCCCSSYGRCCKSQEKERFPSIEYQVLSESHLGKWPLGHPGKSFTMPQTQSEMNYALLQRWGSQESISRSPGKLVITHQPIGKEERSRTSSTGSLSGLTLSTEKTSTTEKAPEIDFLLYYNISSLSLTIHLQRARRLPPKSHKNFVLLLYLSPKTQTGDALESTVLQESEEPVINRSIVFRDLKPEEVRSQTLVFQLYNGSTMGTLVGGVTLPLSDADLYGMNCIMKIDLDRERIKAVNSGDLLLSLVYTRESNTLEGIILKLANLKKHDVAIGLADIYVKIWLLNKGRRTKKWKSCVKQKTPAPVFNESFKFDLGTECSIHDIALELVVMEQDRFSRSLTMGVVYIGMKVPHHAGRQHWEQVIAQSGSRISNWHPVLPVSASS